jgi:hypothetical protein
MPAKKKTNIKKTKLIKKKAKKTTAKASTKKLIKKSTINNKVKKVKNKKLTNNPKTTNRKRRKSLVVVWDERCFFVHNGPALGSLADLSCWLSTADLRNFKYHLTNGHNDFVDWINYVLADKECADKIKKVKTPTGMYKIISRHLKENYV